MKDYFLLSSIIFSDAIIKTILFSSKTYRQKCMLIILYQEIDIYLMQIVLYSKSKPFLRKRSFNTLALEIKEFNKQKNFAGAVNHWNNEIKNGIVPDAFAYAAILSTFRHDNNVQPARFVMEEIRSRNILTSAIGNQMIDLYCRLNDLKSAEDLFESMIGFQMEVRSFGLNALIKALCSSNMEKAIDLLERSYKMGMIIDDSIFTDLAKKALSNRDLQSTKLIISFIKRMKIKLNADIINSIMFSFVIMGDEKEIDEISAWILENSDQNSIVYNSLLGHYAFKNDLIKGTEIEIQMKANMKYSLDTAYQNSLRLRLNNGKLTEAIELSKEIESFGRHSSSHYLQESLGILDLTLGNYDAGFSKLFPNDRYSPPTLDRAISLLVNAYEYDRASDLMEKAIKSSTPQIGTYNKIIKMFADMNDEDNAIKWFKLVKASKTLSPTKFSYLPVIRMLERSGNVKYAEELKLELEQGKKAIDELLNPK